MEIHEMAEQLGYTLKICWTTSFKDIEIDIFEVWLDDYMVMEGESDEVAAFLDHESLALASIGDMLAASKQAELASMVNEHVLPWSVEALAKEDVLAGMIDELELRW